MDNPTAELKGTILRGVFRDAKETLPGGIARLMAALPPEIRDQHLGRNVIHGMWYPYEAFAALLDGYAKVVGRRSPVMFRDLGGRMAARDLTTLLKVYAMISSPQRLADVPRKIWVQRYRNAGLAGSEPGDTSFRFTITGFPGIHPSHCELLTGYGLTTGRQKNVNFSSLHDRCVHRGDSDCSWLSRW